MAELPRLSRRACKPSQLNTCLTNAHFSSSLPRTQDRRKEILTNPNTVKNSLEISKSCRTLLLWRSRKSFPFPLLENADCFRSLPIRLHWLQPGPVVNAQKGTRPTGTSVYRDVCRAGGTPTWLSRGLSTFRDQVSQHVETEWHVQNIWHGDKAETLNSFQIVPTGWAGKCSWNTAAPHSVLQGPPHILQEAYREQLEVHLRKAGGMLFNGKW